MYVTSLGVCLIHTKVQSHGKVRKAAGTGVVAVTGGRRRVWLLSWAGHASLVTCLALPGDQALS